MVTTSGHICSYERYSYARQGLRVLKSSIESAKGANIRRSLVRYLPGLEILTTNNAVKQTQNRRIVVAKGVRILSWQQGKPETQPKSQARFSVADRTGSEQSELDGDANIISREIYYPFGGTAIWTTRKKMEANYKVVRYSGKERDNTGLIYYGYRYYMPWLMRWLNPDPASTVDGLNLFRMVRNNPVSLSDGDGRNSDFNDPFTALAALASFSISAFLARKAFCWLRDRPLRTFAQTFLNMAGGTEDEFSMDFRTISRFAAGGGDLDERTLHISLTRDLSLMHEFTYRQGMQMLKSSLESSFEGNRNESYDIESAFLAKHLIYSEKRTAKRGDGRHAASGESSPFSSSTSSVMNAVPAMPETGRKLRRKGPKSMPAEKPSLPVNLPKANEPQLALSLQNTFLRQKERMNDHQNQIVDGVLEHLQARDYRAVSAHPLEGFDNLYSADLYGFSGTGRGDWRLLFSRNGSTLDVHRIASTHHGKLIKPW
jgi:RHS repeat-associated protein